MKPDTYIDGFVCAVATHRREEYRQFSANVARIFKRHGALSVVECWGDDVPEGQLTSFPMAVHRQADETVVLAWITWPSKDARTRGMQAVTDDPESPKEMPFDGKRLIYGGFELLVDG